VVQVLDGVDDEFNHSSIDDAGVSLATLLLRDVVSQPYNGEDLAVFEDWGAGDLDPPVEGIAFVSAVFDIDAIAAREPIQLGSARRWSLG